MPNSGGARLQEGVVALDAYGAIFREQARANVPQIALIEGVCAGGAAYSPAMGDIVILVGTESRMFLTGPRVVAAVTRERVTADALGGPRIQLANGVAHLAARDQDHAGELLGELLSYLPATLGGQLPFSPPSASPVGCPSEHLPSNTRHVYDVRDVIGALVDSGRHLELGAGWARNMVTTLARLDGHPVGFIANQPRYLGGVIDSAAAEKGAWFVTLCDRLRLPLIVLVDTPGFLPGVAQERAGVIRHGAALLGAFARTTTTKITVTLRQAYGGAHIVMNSRGLGSDLSLAWRNSRIGIMGAHQAVQIVKRRAIANGEDAEELAAAYSDEMLGVDNAALTGSVDEVIEPAQTRTRLIGALELYA
jgi:acetyl-CoA carboxylase carboxyltransferase component